MEAAAAPPGAGPPATRRPGLRLGTVGGAPVVVDASWLLIAVLITVAFAPIAGRSLPSLGPGGRFLVAAAFAVLLYASVLLHELSHAVVARRLGLGVRSITLHVLGGVTELVGEARTPRQDALVSAAGPIVSLATGGLAYAAAGAVTAPVPQFLLLELAWANLVVGVFNLLPGLPLDGGHLLAALVWRIRGDRHSGTIAAGWVGMVLAGVVAVLPWLWAGGVPGVVTLLWSLLLAAFLWSTARSAVTSGRLRRRLCQLEAGRLARPALPVVGHLSLAVAEQQARSAGAQAMVVVDANGRAVGIVDAAAAAQVPPERRPWIGVGTLARRVHAQGVLPSTLAGEALVAAMHAAPADQYLVVDPAGRAGVLHAADVEAALSGS
jgi:Zn-dependent protease